MRKARELTEEAGMYCKVCYVYISGEAKILRNVPSAWRSAFHKSNYRRAKARQAWASSMRKWLRPPEISARDGSEKS